MKDDEAHLRLTIDVHYELGRTDIQDLEQVLVSAADFLAGEGLLSGNTEASVLTWSSGVEELKIEQGSMDMNNKKMLVAVANEIRRVVEAALNGYRVTADVVDGSLRVVYSRPSQEYCSGVSLPMEDIKILGSDGLWRCE